MSDTESTGADRVKVDGVMKSRTRDIGARLTMPPGVALGPSLARHTVVQPSTHEADYKMGVLHLMGDPDRRY